MDKRARWQHRKVLYAILGLIIGFFIVREVYYVVAAWARKTYAVQSYMLVTEGLEDDQSMRIGRWLEHKKEAGLLANPDYEALHTELLQKFPLVASTAWSRLVPEWLTCRVTGAQPLFVVNDLFVMGDNGKLYPRALFPHMSHTDEKVSISREWLEEEVFEQPYQFLMGLPEEFLKVYEVVYCNPSLVVVWPKESLDLPHPCVCIVDQRTVSLLPDTVTLMSLCQGLRDESDDAYDDSVCLFDFRFPGRVIRKCITQEESIHLQRV